jgi:hypothetical protein
LFNTAESRCLFMARASFLFVTVLRVRFNIGL